MHLFILEQTFYKILHELCFRDFILFHPNDFFRVSIYHFIWSIMEAYHVILNSTYWKKASKHHRSRKIHGYPITWFINGLKSTKSVHTKYVSREDAFGTSKTQILIWAKLDDRDYSLVFIICFIIVHDFGKRPHRAYSRF